MKTKRARLGQKRMRFHPYWILGRSGKLRFAMNDPNPQFPKDLVLALSREEAARALGVCAATVDRLTRRGLLRPSRATRRPLYPVWEVERFLRESAQFPAK